MSTVLHTLNRPGYRDVPLRTCLALLRPGDALLLIEDGVYAAVDTPGNRELWHGLPERVACHVLAPDVHARGLSRLQSVFTPVDDAGFVDLVCHHDKTVNWF